MGGKIDETKWTEYVRGPRNNDEKPGRRVDTDKPHNVRLCPDCLGWKRVRDASKPMIYPGPNKTKECPLCQGKGTVKIMPA